jgi:hypothetical protein
MKRVLVALLALVAVALLSGCEDEGEPTRPGAGRSIEGQVWIEQVLTDSLGNNLGSAESPLDGVAVLLMQGGSAVDSTHTDGAEYEFHNVDIGTYVVMVRVTDEVFLASDSLEVASEGDVTCDTLRLAACVNQTLGLTVALPYPNPFETAVTAAILTFQEMRLEVEVFNVGGQLVRTVVDTWWPAGLNPVTWDGKDSVGNLSPAGIYFVVVRGNAGEYFSYASCTRE